MTETSPKESRLLRPLYFVCGLLLTGLGVVGYVTPGLPGTIFLILAAGCFTRSSPRLERWLVTHPRLGPSVVAWRENGAIPRKIKFIAIGSMFLSMAVICLSPAPEWVDWVVGGVMIVSALFVATRPVGPKPAG